MNQTVSIIIPIYNVEKYLAACLDSIIGQTWKELEIILVNDGSTDNCPKVCEEYAAKDRRIKVIHKENGGLSDARNAGLEIATGDFISFVDSDDMISLDFCEKLLYALLSNGADIAECGFLKFENPKEIKQFINSDIQKSEVLDTVTALKRLMEVSEAAVAWNKIFRKEVIDNIRFPFRKINEDEYWTYKVFGNAEKIVKIPNTMYYYRQQQGSIMGQNYSLKRLDGLSAFEERIIYMKSHFPNLENTAIRMYCFGGMHHYHQICRHPEIDPESVYRKKLRKLVKGYNKLSVLKNWYWKYIVWYQLFLWSPKGYTKLRDYMDKKSARVSMGSK